MIQPRDINPKAMWLEIMMISVIEIILKISHLQMQPELPEADELKCIVLDM